MGRRSLLRRRRQPRHALSPAVVPKSPQGRGDLPRHQIPPNGTGQADIPHQLPPRDRQPTPSRQGRRHRPTSEGAGEKEPTPLSTTARRERAQDTPRARSSKIPAPPSMPSSSAMTKSAGGSTGSTARTVKNRHQAGATTEEPTTAGPPHEPQAAEGRARRPTTETESPRRGPPRPRAGPTSEGGDGNARSGAMAERGTKE